MVPQGYGGGCGRATQSAGGQSSRSNLGPMAETELLGRVVLFAELTDAELATIAAAAEQRAVSRGHVLFAEDDDPNELFVVASGRIAIANKSVDGRESVVALMERGDVFGEMGLFEGLGRS